MTAVKNTVKNNKSFVFAALLSFLTIPVYSQVEYYFVIERPAPGNFIPGLTSTLLALLSAGENSAGIILYDDDAVLLSQPVPLYFPDIGKRLSEITAHSVAPGSATVNGLEKALRLADTQAGLQVNISRRLILITADKTASLSAKFSAPQNFDGGIFYLSAGSDQPSSVALIAEPENIWIVDIDSPQDGIAACLETIAPEYKAVSAAPDSFKLGSFFKRVEKAVVVIEAGVSAEEVSLLKSGVPLSGDEIFKYNSYAVACINDAASGEWNVENGKVLAVFQIPLTSKTAVVILIVIALTVSVMLISVILVFVSKEQASRKPAWKIKYFLDGEDQGQKVNLALKKDLKNKRSFGSGVSLLQIFEGLKIDKDAYDKNLAAKSFIKKDKQKGWILVHPDFRNENSENDEQEQKTPQEVIDKIGSTDYREFFNEDENITLGFEKLK